MLNDFISRKHAYSPVVEHLAVLLAFVFITLLMTHPLLFELDARIPGDFDAVWFLWVLWRFKFALEGGESIFFAKEIFYPSGGALYLSTGVPLLSLISVPLQDLFGLFAAYNILFLASYIVGGCTMYWLGRYILKNRWAAFLAALIFAFAPYHSAHAFRHLNLMSIQFIPLFFLFYLRFRERPGWVNATLAAVALAIVGYTEMIYFAMCALYIVFDVAYTCLIQKACPSKSDLKWLLACISIAFLLLGPYLVGAVGEVLFVSYYSSSSISTLVGFSPDVLSFVVPSQFNPFLAPHFLDWYPILQHGTIVNDVEGTVYAGIIVLALVIYSWSKLDVETLKKWKFFLLTSFIFTLGPLAFVFGYIIPFILPYFYAFFLLPLPFMFLRVPARFDILFMLAAAILAGFGYLRLQHRVQLKGLYRHLLPIGISLLILFEFWAPPPFYFEYAPNEFYQKLGNETANYVIFDIPQEKEPDFSTYNTYMAFLQTVHKKTMVGGALSRTPTYVSNFTEQPCVKNLATLNFSTYCTKEGYDQRLGNRIRYVIYHKNAPPWLAHDVRVARISLEQLFGTPVWEDEEIAVYCRFNCSRLQ